MNIVGYGGGTNSTPRIHTPEEFRDLLLKIAATRRIDAILITPP